MTSRKIIAANIKTLRTEKGWSQEKLSVRSKMSLNFIGSLERGKVNVSVDSLDRIAKSLGIETADLLKRE